MSIKNGKSRPKILFVTSHWPLAPAYGAQQRVLNIVKLLSHYGDVSFVIAPGEMEDEETVCRSMNEFTIRMVARPLRTPPGGLLNRLTNRLRHELDPTYLGTDGFMVSKTDREGLQELIQQHDLIWVHTVRVANWFRIDKWPRSMLDVDDLGSRLYESRMQSGGNLLKRLLNHRMYWIWRRRERLFRKRFSVQIVCSENDRRYLGGQPQIHVIPNGCHTSAVRRCVSPQQPRIGFIGNCTFAPNEAGVKWFISDVWPKIKQKCPLAQLRLVGRESKGYLTTRGPDIIGLGWLEDPGDEIASWSAMIVPIKEGSGTRVKVAEGLARRCPIIATTIGAFGYDAAPGEEILLADSAEDFASACVWGLQNPALGEALAERAHKRFMERWQWDSFDSTVEKVVKECIAIG